MDQTVVTWIVASWLVSAAALYLVVRFAVLHALRARDLWRHDGRFDRELKRRADAQRRYAEEVREADARRAAEADPN